MEFEISREALTAAQLAVWFAQQQVGPAPVYQCAERIEITGPFDVERFARVLDDRLRLLPALNSRYADSGDGPYRETSPRSHPLLVHRLDTADHTADHTAGIDEVIARAMSTEPIDDVIDGDRLSSQHLVQLDSEHHVWVSRIHHIAVDGYSFARLLRWVADSYTADLAGEELPPTPFAAPAEPIPTNADDTAFWSEYLDSGRPPTLSRVEAAPARQRARRSTTVLPPRAGTDRGWAESMMAALAVYVNALTDETAITLGVPWAGRRLGAPVTMEPEVNILPLRLQMSPTMTVGHALDAVTTGLREVRPHIGHRADALRRELGLVGADAPLFGPSANLKFFTPQLTFGPATGTVVNIAMGPVDDLTVTGTPRPNGGFVLEVETSPERYSAEETVAHARRLGRLLSLVAETDSDTPLGALPIASPTEMHRETIELNDTGEPVLRDEAESTTLTDLLARSAAAHSDRTALAWEHRTLTYTELWAAATSLAEALRDADVGRGDVVALCLPRSPETVCALLAVLACGAAYLPIDPDLPPSRIDDMLADTRARAVLTTVADGPREDVRWRHGDLALAVRPGPGGEPVRPAAPPDVRDIAYIIFTSGSTGRPKGVAVEHRSIVNRLRWMDNAFAMTVDDRVAQKTPYSFDVSVWEFFWPLISGATLVLPPVGSERDSVALAREFVRQGVTVCHFVPSALAAFLASDPAAAGPNSLRLLVCSGEALPADVLREAIGTLGATEIHNLYGPTEAAVDVTAWAPSAEWTSDIVPIGAPISNTSAYVLDSALRPQPPGAIGELYLAGIQLARGYLGRPALTASRFVADPFVPGERMYATGDLVHRDARGLLIYDGRVDDQVKVRGRRIELGEIQALAAEHPQVAHAAVVTRRTRIGDAESTMIVGYVVPDNGDADPTEIRDDLSRRLPGYMVPDAIVMLDALPMTRNGKLDRRALPEPNLGSNTVIAPRTPTEAALVPVFAAALGRSTVSVTDSFFDLGGTSLTASTLAHRCADLLGAPITVADLFAAPSVAALAERTAGDRSTDPFGRMLTLRPHPAGDAAPPVFAVHPAGGLGWCYAGLLAHLPPTTALFALQADGLDGGSLPTSLADVARDYLDAIDTVVPTGPIRLLGWSVGGVIAHEMAVAAAERGREVSGLLLLDAYPSECWTDRPAAAPEEIRKALLIMAGAESDHELASDDDVVAALRDAGSALGGLSASQVARINTVVEHFATLMRRHRTGVYDGDATHFAATVGAEDFLTPAAWNAHVTGVLTRRELPVNHPGMVAPESLAVIAAALDCGAEPVLAPVPVPAPEPVDAASIRDRIVGSEPRDDADAVIAAVARLGTPVFTDDPTDPARQRVLLTFVADRSVAGVYAWANRLTDRQHGARGQMRRWGSTNLWFSEFSVTRETVATYRFYPYTADDPALVAGELRYSRAVADAGVDDPTNPSAAASPFGSVLRASHAPDASAWQTGRRTIPPIAEGMVGDVGARWRLTSPLGTGAGPARLAVIFDAEKWFDRCHLPEVIADADSAAPTALLGIDSPPGAEARVALLGANHRFLGDVVETVRSARRMLALPAGGAIWAGQSLGGLSALAAAAWFPDAVDELIVYSPSLWWHPGIASRPTDWDGHSWITSHLLSASPRPIRLAVGENEELLVDPVTRIADDLGAAGWRTHLRTYAGGHDLPCWASLLLTDLTRADSPRPR